MLLCAAGVWAAAAPQVVGPADDPYVVDPVNGLIPSAPLVFEKADALTNPVASINIGAVDPSLFPHICTYVDALDAGGVPVGHLPADSFCVYQDGTRLNTFSIQELTFDSCRTATCLVIDVSGSMKDGGKMAAAKNAAKRYVRRMNIYDRTALVKFSDCYTVVQNFTSDTSALINAINSLTAGGRTAYFDGVWRGVGLTTTELGSKAVIALTDGMENNSQNCGGSGTPNGLGDGFANDSTLIVNLANGAGIPIYNVTLGNSFDPQYAIKLSNATGGAHYHAPTNAQLDSIYDAIKFRLCSRYLICYNSPDTVQNGDCHNVIICHKSGNGSCSPCDTGSYCEKAPPVIKRTVATIALDNTCQRWGKTVQLCAYVTDKDTPLNQLTVNLFYRNSNASPYTSVATSRTDSTFCASVPGSQLACGGDSIQYYFTASDGERTVASPTNAPTGHYAFPICPNHAPVCNVPRDTTIAQCAVAQVCLPVTATDQDNNFQSCAKTVGPGTLSGNQWCYTPSGTGTVSVTVRCTDSCGLFCEKTFNVTFSLNSSPVCNVPRDTTIFQCSPAQVCLPTGATDSDGNLTGCSITSGPGTLSGGNWCYTPTGEQSVTVSIRCTDACGAVCEKTFHVTFDINDAPVCGVPRDTTIFQCAPTQVCLPVSATDANGNSTGCSITSGPGTLSGGNWCYTPTGDQTVDVTIRCSDACGAFCEKTFHVTFDINDAPVCNLPRDTTIFQCAPAQVCLPTSATDVNGNLTGCSITSGPGALTSGNWCYTPTGDQTVDVTIRCDDACGAFCEKTFHVTFDVNDAPVCSVPRDTTILQCAPAQVCLPVSATDANGNFTGCSITSGPGTLSGGNWCYTPAGDEAVAVTIRCSDACGAFCEKTFHVTFDINDAPVCDVPRDTSFFQCAPTQVCL
ncbi:MAG: VWA domain-containing protein, partial [candidate division Zixibacteria bacterium]|nr:VWA domain-containing protein [candidate division Zixibacteria bacterium]